MTLNNDWTTLLTQAETLGTSQSRLVELSEVKIGSVQLAVAQNPNTSVATLLKLSKAFTPKVRAAATNNPKITKEHINFKGTFQELRNLIRLAVSSL